MHILLNSLILFKLIECFQIIKKLLFNLNLTCTGSRHEFDKDLRLLTNERMIIRKKMMKSLRDMN